MSFTVMLCHCVISCHSGTLCHCYIVAPEAGVADDVMVLCHIVSLFHVFLCWDLEMLEES